MPSFLSAAVTQVNTNNLLSLPYILADDGVKDDLLGTKLTLDCDAFSGKMNFSLNSVFRRPLAVAQTLYHSTSNGQHMAKTVNDDLCLPHSITIVSK